MRKRKLQKVVSLALSMILTFSLVGCGQTEQAQEEGAETVGQETNQEVNGEENGENDAAQSSVINDGWFPIVNDPITITVSGVNGGTPDWNATDMVEWFESQMGIIMDCTQFEADAWSTQFSLMLASDELPDLIINSANKIWEINQYASDGYFLPINEYLDYAPNLKAFLEEHPDYAAMCTAPDGNIYGLVQYNDNKYARSQRVFIDRTWLENVGMEYPETIEELYDVLKAFAEQDPNGNGTADEIPMSSQAGGYDLFPALMSAFGLYVSDAKYGLVQKDGVVQLAQATDEFREFLKFMNQLCAEGLYDSAGLAQTQDELFSKVKEGRVGVFAAAAPYVALGGDITADSGYYAFGGLTSEYSDQGAMPLSAGVTDGVKMAVSADTEYPEAIVRLIDYFYTPEGILMAAKGTEKNIRMEAVEFDPSFEVAVNIIPEGEEDNYESPEMYRYQKAEINEGFNVVKSMVGTEYDFVNAATDELLNDDEVLNTYGWSILMERRMRETSTVDVMPNLSYNEDEVDRVTTIKTDLGNYTGQAIAQFISGEMDPETDWDSYINTLNQIGLEELLEIEQEAYNRAYSS